MSMSGQVNLPNQHLEKLDDALFHLDIPLNDPQIMNLFSEVKFVCVGGTADRMRQFADYLARESNHKPSTGDQYDYKFENERYCGYKVGPYFCVSHGVGTPSLSIVLHEVFKLLQKAKCSDVTLIRLGTCGGVGVEAGTVVISTEVLTVGFVPVYNTSQLGVALQLPTHVDAGVVEDLFNCHDSEDGFKVVKGKTYCADDFYQGQGRLDGSFCDYGQKEKQEFMNKLKEVGVGNIEMESACIFGMANKVHMKAAVVCAVIVDRLHSDFPDVSKDDIEDFQVRLFKLVGRYMRQKLSA